MRRHLTMDIRTEGKPSEVTDGYWIHAFRKSDSHEKADNFKPRSMGGKWLVFVPISELDGIWERIKKATEDGLLGLSSKTGTARPNPNATDPREKAICVYTA